MVLKQTSLPLPAPPRVPGVGVGRALYTRDVHCKMLQKTAMNAAYVAVNWLAINLSDDEMGALLFEAALFLQLKFSINILNIPAPRVIEPFVSLCISWREMSALISYYAKEGFMAR